MILMLKRQKWIRLATLSLSLGVAASSLGFTPFQTLISRTTAALVPLKNSLGLTSAFQARNWGLANTQGSHINALEAWKIESGSRNIVVAVIDTGVDFTHEALSPTSGAIPRTPSRPSLDGTLSPTAQTRLMTTATAPMSQASLVRSPSPRPE